MIKKIFLTWSIVHILMVGIDWLTTGDVSKDEIIECLIDLIFDYVYDFITDQKKIFRIMLFKYSPLSI